MDFTTTQCDDAFLLSLPRQGLRVTSINLSGSKTITDNGLLALSRAKCLNHLKLDRCAGIKGNGLAINRSLTSLSLEGCRQLDNWTLFFVATLPNLTALNIKNCSGITSVDALKAPGFQSLTSINLQACHNLVSIAALREFQSLTSIDLSQCPRADLAPIFYPPTVWPALSSLNINLRCYEKTIYRIAQWQKLEHLELCAGKDAALGINEALSTLTCLKSLCIKGGLAINESHIGPILNMRALRSLDLGETDDEVTLALSRSMTSIQTLSLAGDGITDVSIAAVAAMTGLESLYVRSDVVTGRGIESWSKLKSLKSLHLGGKNITDRALAKLSCVPSVSTLKLSFCTIDGTGLIGLTFFDLIEFINCFNVLDATKLRIDRGY